MNAKAQEQPVEVSLHRPPRHLQLLCDIRVVAALQEQLDNLLLPWGQTNRLLCHPTSPFGSLPPWPTANPSRDTLTPEYFAKTYLPGGYTKICSTRPAMSDLDGLRAVSEFPQQEFGPLVDPQIPRLGWPNSRIHSPCAKLEQMP
jgi:hypothetical protein